MKGFETSKDYKHLWNLIQSGLRIPGWIKARDGITAIVEIKVNSAKTYMIGTRGFGYESFEQTLESFTETCEHFDLQYVKPNKL